MSNSRSRANAEENTEQIADRMISMHGHVILGAAVGAMIPWTISLAVFSCHRLVQVCHYAESLTDLAVAFSLAAFDTASWWDEVLTLLPFGAILGVLFSSPGYDLEPALTPRVLMWLTCLLLAVLGPFALWALL